MKMFFVMIELLSRIY